MPSHELPVSDRHEELGHAEAGCPSETGSDQPASALVSPNSSVGAHWLPSSFGPSSSVDVPNTPRGSGPVEGS